MVLFGIISVEKVCIIILKKKIFFSIDYLFLDEQIRSNRSEYLVLEIQVPDYCVGSIIGKGGETIKRVRIQKKF